MPDYNYNPNTLKDLALIFFKSDNQKFDTLDCEKLVNNANFFTFAAGDYLTGEKKLEIIKKTYIGQIFHCVLRVRIHILTMKKKMFFFASFLQLYHCMSNSN